MAAQVPIGYTYPNCLQLPIGKKEMQVLPETLESSTSLPPSLHFPAVFLTQLCGQQRALRSVLIV